MMATTNRTRAPFNYSIPTYDAERRLEKMMESALTKPGSIVCRRWYINNYRLLRTAMNYSNYQRAFNAILRRMEREGKAEFVEYGVFFIYAKKY